MPRGFSLYCLRSEGKSWSVLGVCKRCAVTLAALGSQSRSSTAPSRPDAPTKPNLVAAQILPGRSQTETRTKIGSPAAEAEWRGDWPKDEVLISAATIA